MISAERLSRIISSRIGPPETIFTTLVTPQCFGLIFANLVAAISSDDAELIGGVYLYSLVFVLLFSQVVLWCRLQYRSFIVILYCVGVSSLLFFFALFSGVSSFYSFALPMSLVLAGLVFVPAMPIQRLLFCVPPFAFSIVLFAFEVSSEGVQRESLLLVALLIIPVLVLIATRQDNQKAHDFPSLAKIQRKKSPDSEIDSLIEDRLQEVRAEFARMAVLDLRREIFWFPLVFAGTLLAVAVFGFGASKELYPILGVLISLQILLHVSSWRCSNHYHLQILSLVHILVLAGWMILISELVGLPLVLEVCLLLAIYLWLFTVSLRLPYLMVGFLLWALLFLVVVSSEALFLSFLAVIPPLLLIPALLARPIECLREFERSSLFLSRLSPSLSSHERVSFIALCAAQLRIGRGAMLFLQPQLAYVCFSDSVGTLSRSEIKGRHEFDYLSKIDGDAGVLRYNDINEALRLTIARQFSCRPARLLYFRFSYMHDEHPCEGYLLIPLYRGISLFWKRKLFRKLFPIMFLLGRSLAQSHKDMEAAERFTSLEHLIGMYDRHIGLVAHDINNLTQEICSCSDSLRIALSGSQSSESDYLHQTKRIEDLAQHVSFIISDARLLYELSRLKRSSTLRAVPVSDMIESLREYASSYSEIKRRLLVIDSDYKAKRAIKVIHEDYLSACLRWLIRAVLQQIPRDVSLRIDFELQQGVFQLSLSSEADISGSMELSYIVDSINGREVTPTSPQALAVARFLSLSELKTEIQLAPTRVSLYFETESIEQREVAGKKNGAAGWILFIDDNPEVLQFYSRVAAALRVECKTAVDSKAALDTLQALPAPRLIVCDLQLGEESGIRLIENIRDKYGNEIPIVVVSGDKEGIEDGLQEEHLIFKTFLKPLSKAKLFSELQSILDQVEVMHCE